MLRLRALRLQGLGAARFEDGVQAAKGLGLRVAM